MIPGAEAEIQRGLTKWFVEADVESVVLRRRTKVSDGAGGFVMASSALAPQPMRLIPLGSPVERSTGDGKVVTANFALLGLYGADMARFDRFTLGGEEYEVVFLYENKEYETKGEVVIV